MTNIQAATATENGLDRRALMMLTGAAAVAAATTRAEAQVPTLAWDKTFPKSDRVVHQKVTYINRLGITLSADLYRPKSAGTGKLAALVVGTPYGAVKEQAGGFYAQAMAERGFVTLAHDPSYFGESGGSPRAIASHEAMVEDFNAGVDYLGRLPFVDREKIGAVGVCGSGGFALAAAEIDPRIKAVATSVMYDIGQGTRQGLSADFDEKGFKDRLRMIADMRWSEVDGGERGMAIGTPQKLTDKSSAINREFYDYYRTPRGQHPRGTTGYSITSAAAMSMFYSFDKLAWLAPRPVLFVTGETAHSRAFSEQAHRMATGPKELVVVPGAGHVDLYDKANLIPFDQLAAFFKQHLA